MESSSTCCLRPGSSASLVSGVAIGREIVLDPILGPSALDHGVPQHVLALEVPDTRDQALLDPGGHAFGDCALEPERGVPSRSTSPQNASRCSARSGITASRHRRGLLRRWRAAGPLDVDDRRFTHCEALRLHPSPGLAGRVAAVGSLRNDPLEPVPVGRPEEGRAFAEVVFREVDARSDLRIEHALQALAAAVLAGIRCRLWREGRRRTAPRCRSGQPRDDPFCG